jgi:hypothetical protein
VAALRPDLSERTDRELARLRAVDRTTGVVFALVLAGGLLLCSTPLPTPLGGWLRLVVLLTGAANLAISLYGLRLIRRETAQRWHERELWVRREAEPQVTGPTPSVALARLRAERPAA